MSRKVVFFFPSFASSEANAPLGILAVSTPLLRAGYTVRLIDSTITPNFKKRILEEVKDAICLCVSLVTGPMIRETMEIARMRDYLHIAFDRMPIVADTRDRFTRLIQHALQVPARGRTGPHHFLAFPFELAINQKLKRRAAALRPAVDAKRLEPAAAC